jgi:hypothetical protein
MSDSAQSAEAAAAQDVGTPKLEPRQERKEAGSVYHVPRGRHESDLTDKYLGKRFELLEDFRTWRDDVVRAMKAKNYWDTFFRVDPKLDYHDLFLQWTAQQKGAMSREDLMDLEVMSTRLGTTLANLGLGQGHDNHMQFLRDMDGNEMLEWSRSYRDLVTRVVSFLTLSLGTKVSGEFPLGVKQTSENHLHAHPEVRHPVHMWRNYLQSLAGLQDDQQRIFQLNS